MREVTKRVAQEGKLTRKEKKEIRIKRRALRKDLRSRGIKSREEFEIIARQLGLVYGDDDKFLVMPWWWRLGRFIGGLGIKGFLGFLGALALLLTILFAYASLANQKGNFTISVNGDLLRVGFDLSDTEDFKNPKVRLASEILHEVNAISIQDLPDNLDDAEGSHNLDNVVAYTYWVRNAGDVAVDYDWYLVLNSVTKELNRAVWIMIYDEGLQTVYSAPVDETGEAEHLSGYNEPPLYDQAANPDEQYYQTESGKWGIKTTPYVQDRIVAKGTVENFQPDERRKYTVVIWVEGDDPECTNDILGSHAGYAMKYTLKGDDGGIFDDLIFADIDTPEEMDEIKQTESE